MEKSAVALHCWEKGHQTKFKDTRILYRSSGWNKRVIRESLEIVVSKGNLINLEQGTQCGMVAVAWENGNVSGKHLVTNKNHGFCQLTEKLTIDSRLVAVKRRWLACLTVLLRFMKLWAETQAQNINNAVIHFFNIPEDERSVARGGFSFLRWSTPRSAPSVTWHLCLTLPFPTFRDEV